MATDTKESVPFGLHLMVDAYKCDPAVLNDANTLYKVLDTIPELLHMKKMIKPYVVTTPGNGQHDPGGWSGFVIIEESHVSLHTFVKKGFVTLDVYSCQMFDTEPPLKYIREVFKTNDLEVYTQVRGQKYPSENIHK